MPYKALQGPRRLRLLRLMVHYNRQLQLKAIRFGGVSDEFRSGTVLMGVPCSVLVPLLSNVDRLTPMFTAVPDLGMGDQFSDCSAHES